MHKPVLIALAVWHGANGIFMLVWPNDWYRLVPGVTHTGPFNPHFVADIAIAFLVSAIALGSAAWRTGALAAALLLAPALFLGGHAILHFVEFFHGHLGVSGIARDVFLILLPGLLPVLVAWRSFRQTTKGVL